MVERKEHMSSVLRVTSFSKGCHGNHGELASWHRDPWQSHKNRKQGPCWTWGEVRTQVQQEMQSLLQTSLQLPTHIYSQTGFPGQHSAWQLSITGCDCSGNWMSFLVSPSKSKADVNLRCSSCPVWVTLCYCLSNDRGNWKLLRESVEFF